MISDCMHRADGKGAHCAPRHNFVLDPFSHALAFAVVAAACAGDARFRPLKVPKRRPGAGHGREGTQPGLESDFADTPVTAAADDMDP
jgi:hypothetical protein